jgi:hypothetical protein
MKLGIAISLYDKFDELAVLHDIFKHNFNNKFYLYVCSNHKHAQAEIDKRGLEFDGYVQGDNILYDDSLSEQEKRVSIVCRSTSTVQKSCKLAMENVDYVMHIHCDAWPLNEESLLKHFKSIIDTDYRVAFRGLGFSKYRNDTPLGHVDDHFFIFNSTEAKKSKLFEFKAQEMLPHKLTVHGILSANILTKIGMKNILFFDIFKKSNNYICWEGVEKIFPSYPVKPSLMDKKRQFLHVHKESFPENYGQQLQSYYLNNNNIKKGRHVVDYIFKNKYSHNLHIELSNLLDSRSKKINSIGLNSEDFGQDIVYMQTTISQTTFTKVFRNYILKFLNYLLSLLGLVIFRKQMSIYPETIKSYYSRVLNKDIFN